MAQHDILGLISNFASLHQRFHFLGHMITSSDLSGMRQAYTSERERENNIDSLDSEGLVVIIVKGGESGGDAPSSTLISEVAPQQRPLSTCMICYEDIELSDKLPNLYDGQQEEVVVTCPHAYCHACIRSYLESRVGEGRRDYPCPMYGQEGCNYYFRNDLSGLMDEKSYQKHVKFTLMRQDPCIRECPQCSFLCQGGTVRSPLITCPRCEMQFCFLHNNAHPQQSCKTYARELKAREKASNRTVQRISKPCPSCMAPTEKAGGCNHISCVNCLYQWCWLCHQQYTPLHYSPTNIFFGCPGGQFIDCGGTRNNGGGDENNNNLQGSFCTSCCCSSLRLSTYACRCSRVGLALLLLPLPFTLGVLVAISFTLLWIPIGVMALIMMKVLPSTRRYHQRVWGGLDESPWDVVFPLISSSRAFRHGNGRLAAIYIFVFLGATPIILLFSVLLELCWLPLAFVILVFRVILAFIQHQKDVHRQRQRLREEASRRGLTGSTTDAITTTLQGVENTQTGVVYPNEAFHRANGMRPFVPRDRRRVRIRPSFLFAPIYAANNLLDLDGE